MKTIYLIRHAKSSWKETGMSDFDRDLNRRGKEDRITMGKRLAKENCSPNVFLSSSAKRTKQTSQKIAELIGFDVSEISFLRGLYLATSSEMLNVINKQNNDLDNLIMVGHNPGISDLATLLLEEDIFFPTCGIVKITFETNTWQEVFNGTGSLEFFDYPKNNSL